MIRALIVVLALLAGGWLAVQERAARAGATSTRSPSAPEAPSGRAPSPARRSCAAPTGASIPTAAGPLRGDRARPRRPPREAIAVLGGPSPTEPENLEAWRCCPRAARDRGARARRPCARPSTRAAPPVPERLSAVHGHAIDEVERAVQRLLVHARHVAAEDADADELHAAEEQHRDEDPDAEAGGQPAGDRRTRITTAPASSRPPR